MSRRPYPGFYFSNDARMFHVVVKMKDVPGALSDVLSTLHETVDLVSSFSYNLGDGTAMLSCFGRSLSPDGNPAQVKAALEQSPMVVECQVKKGGNGVIVDTYHDGVEIAPGRPAIVIDVAGFSRVCDHISKLMGTGGETILFEEGSALGQMSGRFLKDKIGQGRLDQRVEAALDMYKAAGWGSGSLDVERNGAQYRITVRNCLECSEPSAVRKECVFLKGHLLRLVGSLSGEEFGIEETKCRLRGADCCEFLLARREAEAT